MTAPDTAMPNLIEVPPLPPAPPVPAAPPDGIRHYGWTAALVGIILLVAVLDRFTREETHYIQFLILVPVLAAMLTGPLTTGVLTVACVGISLLVGLMDHEPLAHFHIPAAIGMGAAGVIGSWAAIGQREITRTLRQRELEHRRDMGESLSLLRATLESTADGILVVDLQQRVTSFNGRFTELWELPGDVLAERRDAALVEAVLAKLVDPEAFLRRIRELYDHPDEESFDTLIFKDGRVVERYSKPQMIDTRIVGRVWSFRDVSERLHAEAERARLRESLARSESMSAIGGLVAGVAHEVRNPLFTISASLDTFDARFGTRPEYRAYIDALRGSVDRLSRLMNQLLDYGRPPQSAPEPLSLAECVERAIDIIPSTLADRGVTIDNGVPVDLPPTLLDRHQILQVFRNLLENAIQHSPVLGRVTVTGRPMTWNGRAGVECLVEDSGSGFNPGPIGRIFEPFVSERFGGTGLGLSIVLRIVEQHGGHIDASNRPEGGASIRLWFPVADPGEP